MGKPPHVPVVLALAALGLGASASCLDPTQITLEISTNAACADTKGTTFIGGGAGVTGRSAPNATSTRCIDGDLGTLVATPSDNKDAEARFIIVTGIDRPSRECTPDNKYKGCIVQRRALRYAKHRPVSLPIRMWLVCKDKECDENSTCARNGKCVPARIADPDACASAGCFPDGDPDPDADGGSPEGGPLDEAGGDGGPFEVDGATADSAAEAGDSALPPSNLYCPPSATGCEPGGMCCWSRTGAMGACDACTQKDLKMLCNGKSDCLDGVSYCTGSVVTVDPGDGGPPYRFLDGTSCGPGTKPGNAFICRQSTDCPAGETCDLGSDLFTPTGVFGECK